MKFPLILTIIFIYLKSVVTITSLTNCINSANQTACRNANYQKFSDMILVGNGGDFKILKILDPYFINLYQIATFPFQFNITNGINTGISRNCKLKTFTIERNSAEKKFKWTSTWSIPEVVMNGQYKYLMDYFIFKDERSGYIEAVTVDIEAKCVLTGSFNATTGFVKFDNVTYSGTYNKSTVTLTNFFGWLLSFLDPIANFLANLYNIPFIDKSFVDFFAQFQGDVFTAFNVFFRGVNETEFNSYFP